MSKGNAAALAAARKRDSDQKRGRVRAALKRLADEGDPISFLSVARAAGVSEGLVHHRDLKPLILEARERQAAEGVTPKPSDSSARGDAPSTASLLADVQLVRDDNRRLRDELARLKQRLRAKLGDESDPELRFALDRVAAAEAISQRLSRENAELRAAESAARIELAERVEELASLRAAHSRLMRRVNGASEPTLGGVV